MKRTPNQILNEANGVKRIRAAVSEAYVIRHITFQSATDCRTMFSERSGKHIILGYDNRK